MTHATIARIATPCMTVSLLATVSLASGCKEEPVIEKLFDENGVWALVKYDPEGDGNETDIADSRENKFMFKFTPGMNVVQTASCIWPGDSADPAQIGPGDTPCGKLTDLLATEWSCQCFGYAFEEDRMRWVEFNAGDTPPVVTLEPMAGDAAADGSAASGGATGDGGTGDGGDGGDDGGSGGGGGDGTSIIVSEVTGVGFTYFFRPLPDGLFTSNGTTSRFQMQARGESVFEEVFDDPMRTSCEPCI